MRARSTARLTLSGAEGIRCEYTRSVPPGAIYVGRAGWGLRASPYANPHKPAAKTYDAHAAAVAAYRQHLRGRPDLVAGIRAGFSGGQDAACWCDEPLPCHGDVILAVARGEEP